MHLVHGQRVKGKDGQPRVILPARQLLGHRLVEAGALAPGDLVRALALQARQDARLGDLLLTHKMVSRHALMSALAEQWEAEVVDLKDEPPDTRLIDLYGVAACLNEGLVPWRRAGNATVIATARPEKFAAARSRLEPSFGKVVMALTTEEDVALAVATLRSPTLARRAEVRVESALSCRTLTGGPPLRYLMAAMIGFAAFALAWPVAAFGLLLGWACLTLAATTGLKLAAVVFALQEIRRRRPGLFSSTRRHGPTIARLPIVSVLVPLFREADIAGHLLRRLERLTYPRELTDILLVCEEDDATTASALAAVRLPSWVRVVRVPRGGVQTKPRALNYALDFCRGQIVGVWDAEDAPAPDQLHVVVKRFHERDGSVACLQGILDYYNSRRNWLSRCFTIEYASWFRVVLPGLQRLGLALPLGGTTVFFRRAALESLGGWDAHNVTEDADLGIRLARAGYRTEMIDSVTAEEANSHVIPWIRQRSRWLKGYALTWAVHTRNPRQLWRDLGPRAFFGFHVLFIGTLSQFLLAPILWSCWALILGLPHPLSSLLSPQTAIALSGFFVGAEVITLALGLLGLRAAGKLTLAGWIPMAYFYFPLAVMAAYKAAYEMLSHPFYWDKTAHGKFGEDDSPD